MIYCSYISAVCNVSRSVLFFFFATYSVVFTISFCRHIVCQLQLLVSFCRIVKIVRSFIFFKQCCIRLKFSSLKNCNRNRRECADFEERYRLMITNFFRVEIERIWSRYGEMKTKSKRNHEKKNCLMNICNMFGLKVGSTLKIVHNR